MAFKSFLVFHALEEPTSALKPVIELAQEFDAHLDVVVLASLMTPSVAMYDGAPASYWAELNNEMSARAAERVNDVEKMMGEMSVSATVAAECNYIGQISHSIARYSLCVDACVVDKRALQSQQAVAKAFDGALFEAGCPILLIGEKAPNLNPASTVIIAWNGRPEASKAVHRSLPISQQAKEVHVVAVDPNEADFGEDPGDDIATFLARHDVKATVDAVPSGGKSVVETLLQRAKDLNADLLVMGGYGHSKTREWILGGATRDILDSADLPVFLVH